MFPLSSSFSSLGRVLSIALFFFLPPPFFLSCSLDYPQGFLWKATSPSWLAFWLTVKESFPPVSLLFRGGPPLTHAFPLGCIFILFFPNFFTHPFRTTFCSFYYLAIVSPSGPFNYLSGIFHCGYLIHFVLPHFNKIPLPTPSFLDFLSGVLSRESRKATHKVLVDRHCRSFSLAEPIPLNKRKFVFLPVLLY